MSIHLVYAEWKSGSICSDKSGKLNQGKFEIALKDALLKLT